MQAGVVGAGIMGRLLALVLHNAGWQVTVFEQNAQETNCSAAAAGLLAPISELDKADLVIYRLGQESINKYWSSVLQLLPESIYFQQLGSLVLHHPNDQGEWEQFSRRILAKLDKSVDDTYYQQLSQNSLSEYEPELGKFAKAYYFPDEAQIDSQSLLPALKKYLCSNGIRWINTQVLALEPGKILAERHSQKFDMVFDCRGLGARTVFRDLRAIRGELLCLHAPEVHVQRPIRFLHPRYSLYIIPRPANVYLLGASEIEAEDYSPISVRTTLELLTASYYVHPGFAEARIIKTLTHCRPTLSHHLPRIKFTNGLIAVNGLYRHGYLLAPSLAEEILRWLKPNRQSIHYPEIWEDYYDNHLSQ
jgi:glycine oxidase